MERLQRSLHLNIECDVKQHLTNVYSSLTAATFVAAVGAYVHICTNLASAGFLSFFAGMGCLIALYAIPPEDKNIMKRMGCLMGFAFTAGLGMGPLINYSIALNESIVLTALMTTTLVFASFTFSALYARRGYYLMLAGPLTTLLSTLLALSLANLFFGSQLLFQVNIYLGLLAMCGFVLYDTTIIMEKRRMGDKDFIAHSIDLFIDFIGIFKRVLVLLMQREEDSRRRRRD